MEKVLESLLIPGRHRFELKRFVSMDVVGRDIVALQDCARFFIVRKISRNFVQYL